MEEVNIPKIPAKPAHQPAQPRECGTRKPTDLATTTWIPLVDALARFFMKSSAVALYVKNTRYPYQIRKQVVGQDYLSQLVRNFAFELAQDPQSDQYIELIQRMEGSAEWIRNECYVGVILRQEMTRPPKLESDQQASSDLVIAERESALTDSDSVSSDPEQCDSGGNQIVFDDNVKAIWRKSMAYCNLRERLGELLYPTLASILRAWLRKQRYHQTFSVERLRYLETLVSELQYV